MVYIMTLESVEQLVAEQGLTHSNMLAFFRLIPTNDGSAILPTFTHWVEQLHQAGVLVDETWYERMVVDYTAHGRLTAETLLQAPPASDIKLGADDPNVL